MHWLLQSNLGTQERQQPYIDALEALTKIGATWSYIKLIPFVGDVEPNIDYSGKKVFALGSTSMIIAAKKYGWNPGVIYNENFRFEAWLDHLHPWNLLNGDGIVIPFGDANPDVNVFIRPCEDLKAFTGFVIEPENLRNWQKSIKAGEISTRAIQLGSDTPIVMAPAKLVLREWRFFIVDGKVITGSQYRTLYGKDESRDIDQDVYEFAQKMVDLWRPADCYVLDVGETAQNGLQMIEINNFNTSGIYMCDAKAAFAAVEKFYER